MAFTTESPAVVEMRCQNAFSETHNHGIQRPEKQSRLRTATIVVSAASATGIASILSGLMTVILPQVVKDFNLGPKLVLWPVSIYALANGCTLLLVGTVTDVVGSRRMYLLGNILQCAFTLASGLSRNGTQMIVIRGFCGAASSFCLPSAVSIVTTAFPPGPRRSAAFASMGGGLPIGFAVGLLLGGVCASTIGWDWAFHITSMINAIILVLFVWQLPQTEQNTPKLEWKRFQKEIDWAGVLFISCSLAMLLYVLSSLSNSTSALKSPANVVLLSTALALIPIFAIWMHYQKRCHRPALIPNTLWQNKMFTCVCINVFLIWGVFTSVEQFVNFYFQNIKRDSTIRAGIQFLPSCVAGAVVNLTMALIVSRIRGDWIIYGATTASSVAPLLMALIRPNWSYWAGPFPAVTLNAIQGDVFYTIANLLITSSFPDNTQALAGAVFNTVAQIGKAVGVTLSALVSESVSRESDTTGTGRLLEGYHAAFWFSLAMSLATLFVSSWGLHGIGKVGSQKTMRPGSTAL